MLAMLENFSQNFPPIIEHDKIEHFLCEEGYFFSFFVMLSIISWINFNGLHYKNMILYFVV